MSIYRQHLEESAALKAIDLYAALTDTPDDDRAALLASFISALDSVEPDELDAALDAALGTDSYYLTPDEYTS